jgi:hypothetical protein
VHDCSFARAFDFSRLQTRTLGIVANPGATPGVLNASLAVRVQVSSGVFRTFNVPVTATVQVASEIVTLVPSNANSTLFKAFVGNGFFSQTSFVVRSLRSVAVVLSDLKVVGDAGCNASFSIETNTTTLGALVKLHRRARRARTAAEHCRRNAGRDDRRSDLHADRHGQP